ncbi:MAG: hypothetical protein IPG98_10715 [Burkholderiales bacterium]|nr:hypothetical protein [Burkholderiales bacterium]MBK8664722.1 hypothetical protein [Burkholderiales bacterium]
MLVDHWGPILEAMVRVYPEACSCTTIETLTGLPRPQVTRIVRELTRRSLIAFDASDKSGNMLSLTEAGMAVGCNRVPSDGRLAPDLLHALQAANLSAWARCRQDRRARLGVVPAR